MSKLYKDTFSKVKCTDEFKEQLLEIPNAKRSKSPKRITISLVAAVLVVLSVFGVFAGTRLYSMYATNDYKYAKNIVLEKEVGLELSKSDNISRPEYVNIKLDYLPKGFKAVKNGKVSYYNSLSDTPNISGITLALYDVSNFAKIKDYQDEVVNTECKTVNGYDTLYVEMKHYGEQPATNQRLYMYFPEYDYLVYMWVSSDISKKEIYKVAEGIQIQKCNREDAVEIYDWYDYEDYDEYTDVDTNIDNRIDFSENNLVNIGDSFYPISMNDFVTNSISTKVDSVKICDNIDFLKNQKFCFGEFAYNDYIDEDGNLNPLIIKCYGGGDGKNSLDKLQSTKKVNLKFIYVTETITNSSSKQKEVTVDQSVKSYYDCNDSFLKLNDYNKLLYDEHYKYRIGEWVYDDFSTLTNSSNTFTMPPNSSRTIHIGYFVPEQYLQDEMYLCLDNGWSRNYGTTYEATYLKIN